MCVARHAQITQNKNFAISLQYRKKEVNGKVDFLYASKHGNLLQIDTMIFLEMVKLLQSSRNKKFAISLQYLKKQYRYGVGFLHAGKHHSGLHVASNTLGTRFSYKVILSLLMSMMKHSQSTQRSVFVYGCFLEIGSLVFSGTLWAPDFPRK